MQKCFLLWKSFLWVHLKRCSSRFPLIHLISDSPPSCQDPFIIFWLIPVAASGQKVSGFPSVGDTPEERNHPLMHSELDSLLSCCHSCCGNPYGCSTGKETPGNRKFFPCLKAKLATWGQAEANLRMKYPWKVTDLISVTCAPHVHGWQPAWKNFQTFAIREPNGVPGTKLAMVIIHVAPSKWFLLANQTHSTSKMYCR